MAAPAEVLALAWKIHEAGGFLHAEQLYRQVLEHDDTHVEAWCCLAGACQAQGKLAQAETAYRRAVQLAAHDASIRNNLGIILAQQGKHAESEAVFQQVLELAPEHVDALNNLALVQKNQGKLTEAAKHLRQATRLKPNYPAAHNTLGNVLQDQGKLDEAIASYDTALQLQPVFPEAHCNLGCALHCQGKLDAALAHHEQALRFKTDFAEAHWNRALLWLLRGDFERGWPEYEWRWRRRCQGSLPFKQPAWNGSSLHGRTILIHGEQGLGDTIQFVRFVPLVKRHGGRVIVRCQQALAGLLANFPGIDQLVPENAPLPAFDIYALLLSLPGIFRTNLATIPGATPYLGADADLVKHWRQRLGQPGFKIGIAWHGCPTHGGNRNRSIPLARFAALAKIPGVRLISLQKGKGVEELRTLPEPFPVVDLESQLGDCSQSVANIAAIIKNVDLVISCDTAVAHLAGALGAKVWLALPHIPDWRWLLDRDDSPWYPTMRLFRQTISGNWEGVFDHMAAELQRQAVIAKPAAAFESCPPSRLCLD